MVEIQVVLGDITAQDIAAVVTVANESLLGGGVDGAVHRAAGPRLAEAGAKVVRRDGCARSIQELGSAEDKLLGSNSATCLEIGLWYCGHDGCLIKSN
jgi:O-acetyl-ADP-ribose deacetylase (regulator of RNase III)